MFYKAACTLYNHLGYTLMMLRKLIKCGINNFHVRSLYCFPDIGNFLRTFINKKNDQMHILVILRNRFRNILEQSSFTCLRRGNDHTTLSLSDRADQIYDTHGSSSARPLHDQTFIWEDWGHIFKIVSLLSLTWMETIDRRHIQKGTEFLPLCFNTDISLNNIPCLQIESADL